MCRSSFTLAGWAWFGIIALLLCGWAGCGPRMPRTYPVEGKVSVKGGKLAPKSTIIFQLASDTSVTADGEIQPDGSFTVFTRLHGKSQAGAVEGDHTVLIHEGSGGTEEQKGFRPIVVAKKCTVEARANQFTIEAVKPGRR